MSKSMAEEGARNLESEVVRSEVVRMEISGHRFDIPMTQSNYRPALVLSHSHGLKYLPHWREIDRSLKEMFDGFGEVAASAAGRRESP